MSRLSEESMDPQKGFREDDQFRTEAEQQKASKDLLEYKDGDPIWKIKEVDGYIYMQLDKPGYACNPQEFIEIKIFVSYMVIRYLSLCLFSRKM